MEVEAVVDFRLAFNRDEERTRQPARFPTMEVHGNRKAILPRDPEGGGTWIAVTEVGLAFALLNVNPPGQSSASSGGLSRGAVIPALLSADSIESVADMLPATAHEILRPFRLIVTDGRTWFEALGRLGTVMCSAHVLGEPIMRSSSGLGDDMVEAPRRSLFESMFKGRDGSIESIQDEYHASRFPDHDEQSVDMSRDDARTVSTAVITVTATEVAMEYAPGAPRENVAGSRYVLERSHLPDVA
jgi:hypothetical protein